MLRQGQVRHRSMKSDEDRANEIHVISFEEMGPYSKEDKSEEIVLLHIFVGTDRKSKSVSAHIAPRKVHDLHAIKVIDKEIRLAGYS